MSTIIHHTSCPVCGYSSIKEILVVKDHSVSHESFQVMECDQCTLRFTQNIPDAASIAPYYKSEDYISHTNTSKGLINRLYQSVRKRTMVGKRKLVQKATGLDKGSLLDIGSGTGTFAHEMKSNGWDVTGLEPDADARQVAKQLYGVDLSDTAQLYQLAPGSFDAITLWHVMEHVHELDRYVQQMKTLLKDKGRLFIAVPNYTSGDASVYKEFWAAYDVPRHLYHFSPQSVKTLVEKHGMRIEQYKPMWYDSFYISLLSSKYKNGKSNLVAAGWNGFVSNCKALFDVKRCSSVIYVISK